MKKRLFATVLWFYATWYAWSIVADMTGMPALLGPAVGLGVAAFIGLDPMNRIWTKRTSPEPAALSALEPDPA